MFTEQESMFAGLFKVNNPEEAATELCLSMIRDYIRKKEPTVSALVGQNCCFRSFRIHLPEHPEADMLYLQQQRDKIAFFCQSGSFSLYHTSMERAVALTLEACQYYDHWEKALFQAVWDTPDYQTLIDTSEEVFENPMLITNWQGKLLGSTSSYRDIPIRDFWTQMNQTGVLPISCLQNLRESSHFDILKEENQVNLLYFEKFDYTCILGLVHENHEIILHFQIVEFHRKITETDLLLARTFLSVLRRAHRELQPAYRESATYVFSQLLSGRRVDSRLLNWVLSSLGWTVPEQRYYVVCFQVMDQKGNAKSMLLQLERSVPGSKVLIHEDMLVLLLSKPLFERFQNDLRYVNEKWHLSCGVSMPFDDWENLQLYYHQAASVAGLSKRDAKLHFCQEYAMFFLMDDLRQSIAARHMGHPAVQILAEYDRKNHTELVKTLQTFLLCERNSTLTAEKLNLHRNTLQYRVHKIEDLVPMDLEDADVRLHLLLTCLIPDQEKMRFM